MAIATLDVLSTLFGKYYLIEVKQGSVTFWEVRRMVGGEVVAAAGYTSKEEARTNWDMLKLVSV